MDLKLLYGHLFGEIFFWETLTLIWCEEFVFGIYKFNFTPALSEHSIQYSTSQFSKKGEEKKNSTKTESHKIKKKHQ